MQSTISSKSFASLCHVRIRILVHRCCFSSTWKVDSCPLFLPAVQKWKLRFALWLNPRAMSLDAEQTFQRLGKKMYTHMHTHISLKPLQTMKMLCWGSHKSASQIFLYYITHSDVRWQQCLPGGWHTTDIEGAMLIPSALWGYFWFSDCHHYLRSVAKQLSKIFDGLFLSNFLLEHVGELWMRKSLACVLCYTSGCNKLFWRVKVPWHKAAT